MTGFIPNIRISAYLCLLILSSCFSAPIEININKKIKIDENIYKGHINNLGKEIVKQLGSNENICVDTFSRWLEKQLSKFRIPKRIVSADEYAPNVPAAKHCPAIDLEEKIPAAWQKLVQQDKIKVGIAIFNIDKLRNKLEKTECLKELIDPKNNNLTLKSIKTKISGNTLNFDVPVYKIYYATRKLDKKETENSDAEDKLLAFGAIKLLGATRTFKSGYVGFQEFDFVQDPQEYQAALKTLQGLSANLIAFPQDINEAPELRLAQNESYFIIPKGEAELNIKLDILINMNLSSIGCVLKISENI